MTKTFKCHSTFEGKPCPGASAPHRRGMCVLAGVNELRDAVQWANSTPEIEHDHLTAEEVLARFRAARDGRESGPITADTITDEQIRDLCADSRALRVWGLTRSECDVALGVNDGELARLARRLARARCAEILNARQVAKP